jgi:hypothetical protein
MTQQKPNSNPLVKSILIFVGVSIAAYGITTLLIKYVF